jgi:hypothetical protein
MHAWITAVKKDEELLGVPSETRYRLVVNQTVRSRVNEKWHDVQYQDS